MEIREADKFWEKGTICFWFVIRYTVELSLCLDLMTYSRICIILSSSTAVSFCNIDPCSYQMPLFCEMSKVVLLEDPSIDYLSVHINS
jgi:hypothetical protein